MHTAESRCSLCCRKNQKYPAMLYLVPRESSFNVSSFTWCRENHHSMSHPYDLYKIHLTFSFLAGKFSNLRFYTQQAYFRLHTQYSKYAWGSLLLSTDMNNFSRNLAFGISVKCISNFQCYSNL